MKIRNRVKQLRFVKASELIPSPSNWRTHPKAQKDALKGLLAEIGYADALLARETPDGLQLIDGHLRAETTPDAEVPVLVVDLTDEEADKVLLTLDPLAAMAGKDDEKLKEMLAGVEFQSKAVGALLETIAGQEAWQAIKEPEESAAPQAMPEQFMVIIDCRNEAQQAELLERLSGEGLSCRALIS